MIMLVLIAVVATVFCWVGALAVCVALAIANLAHPGTCWTEYFDRLRWPLPALAYGVGLGLQGVWTSIFDPDGSALIVLSCGWLVAVSIWLTIEIFRGRIFRTRFFDVTHRVGSAM